MAQMHSGQLPVHSFQVHQQGSSGSINALADNIPRRVGVTDDRGDSVSVTTDMTVLQCDGSVTACVTACQCDDRCDSASA